MKIKIAMPMEGTSKNLVRLRGKHVAVHFRLTSMMRLDKFIVISDLGENHMLLLTYVKLPRIMEKICCFDLCENYC
ncbi:hypothetical protein HCR08_06260 [Wolbachia pipientis]|uniref:hypothetical protein n=1 Tax=Wolbachia pipientis TaxID=955 RepID=UPI0015F87FB2|nr:hypothetical protein [Wolbachia pipientis]MBA8755559.1 hypothetical protein [Wolbachia pipientis]